MHAAGNMKTPFADSSLDTEHLSDYLPWLLDTSSGTDVSKALSCQSDDDLYNLCTTITASGHTVVHLLVQRQKLDSLKGVLARGVDVNTRDAQGATPIHTALQYHALPAAQILIDHGADVAEVVSRRKGTTLLHKLVMRDRPAAVQLLLENGAEVNARDKQRRTALHMAAVYGRGTIAALLLQRESCDVNALDQTGHTPLMLAITNNNTDLARQLAAAPRTDVALRDRDGMSSLHLAVALGQLEVVRAILARNTANLNSKERSMGRTPLHLACAITTLGSASTTTNNSNSKDSSRKGARGRVSTSLSVLDTFSENGEAPAGYGRHSSKSPSKHRNRDSPIVSVNFQECEIDKPMSAGSDAAASSQSSGFRMSPATSGGPYYLKTGATLRHPKSSQTPVRKDGTSQQGSSLAANRPRTAPQRRKPTGLCVNGSESPQRSRPSEVSNIAALRCKMVTLLLDLGADANLMTAFRKSPLHITAASGAADVMAQLLPHTTNPNMLSMSNKTALHLAAENGHAVIVPLLVSAGANLGLRDLAGMTALHAAARLGHANVVAALLKGGADLNGADFRQMTPLHHACHNGHADVADMLVRAGCRTDLMDDSGHLALYYSEGCIVEESLQQEEDVVTPPVDAVTDRTTIQSRRRRKEGAIILAQLKQE